MAQPNLLVLLTLVSPSVELRVVWRKRSRFSPCNHSEILGQLRRFGCDLENLIDRYSTDQVKRDKVPELLRARSAVERAMGLLTR